MNTLGNLIWFIFGGFVIAIEYLISAILLMITLIGIPFGLQIFKFARLALWPFGKEVRDAESGSSGLSLLMNILWIVLGGFWIAITHVLFGLFFFITIIGIPFGKQHFKLAQISLTPFGKRIVTKD